jgi:hypothetical protein
MGMAVEGCWHLPCMGLAGVVTVVVGAGVGFLWLEAVGVAGPCPVSQDRRRQLS